MSAAIKKERLDVRLTEEQKSTIEQAASLSGQSLTDFTVNRVVEQARQVIKAEKELRMSEAAWDEFSKALDAPARPIAELASLLSRPSVFVD